MKRSRPSDGKKSKPKRKRRLSIRGGRGRPALVLDRIAIRTRRLVYVAVSNKAIEYPDGSSCILYIGTTKNGIGRVAASAASRSGEMFAHRGVKEARFYVLTCRSRQRVVKLWHKMERGLIMRFREIYGTPPVCNKQGVGMRWRDELIYFSSKGLESLLRRFE